jgi:hypothetical protein
MDAVVPRDPAERKKLLAMGGRPKSGRAGSARPSSRPASAQDGGAGEVEEKKEGDSSEGKEGGESKEAGAEDGAAAAGEEKKSEDAPAAEGAEAPAEGQAAPAEGDASATPAASGAEGEVNVAAAGGDSSAPAAEGGDGGSSSADAVAPPVPIAAPVLGPIGGLVHLDLLTMPPNSSLVKGWAMSRASVNARPTAGVRRVPHPALSQGVTAAAAQALKVKVSVPPTVIVPEAVSVARWDPEGSGEDGAAGGVWTTSHVSDVQYEPATRTLTFSSVYMTPHAICRPPHLDLPYGSWSLAPTHATASAAPSVTLRLATTRFPVEIAATAAGCTLIGPQLSELQDLMSAPPMRPGRLLHELRRRGVNLIPEDSDAHHAGTGAGAHPIRPKDRALERQVYADIAEVGVAFELASSEWNMHPSVGTGDIVLRARERVRGSVGGSGSWSGDSTAWRMVRFSADSGVPSGMRVLLTTDVERDARGRDVLVQPPAPAPAAPAEGAPAADGGAPPPPAPLPEPVLQHVDVAYKGDVEPGAMSHASARLALNPRTSPGAQKEVSSASPLLLLTLQRLLSLTRPCSFAAGPPSA